MLTAGRTASHQNAVPGFEQPTCADVQLNPGGADPIKDLRFFRRFLLIPCLVQGCSSHLCGILLTDVLECRSFLSSAEVSSGTLSTSVIEAARDSRQGSFLGSGYASLPELEQVPKVINFGASCN